MKNIHNKVENNVLLKFLYNYDNVHFTPHAEVLKKQIIFCYITLPTLTKPNIINLALPYFI